MLVEKKLQQSGVLEMMNIKTQKSFGAVRGSTLLSTLATLTVTGSIRTIVSITSVFVSSELYLLDWAFFSFGVFTFFFLKSPRQGGGKFLE